MHDSQDRSVVCQTSLQSETNERERKVFVSKISLDTGTPHLELYSQGHLQDISGARIRLY